MVALNHGHFPLSSVNLPKMFRRGPYLTNKKNYTTMSGKDFYVTVSNWKLRRYDLWHGTLSHFLQYKPRLINMVSFGGTHYIYLSLKERHNTSAFNTWLKARGSFHWSRTCDQYHLLIIKNEGTLCTYPNVSMASETFSDEDDFKSASDEEEEPIGPDEEFEVVDLTGDDDEDGDDHICNAPVCLCHLDVHAIADFEPSSKKRRVTAPPSPPRLVRQDAIFARRPDFGFNNWDASQFSCEFPNTICE